jgi:hypothetical protein
MFAPRNDLMQTLLSTRNLIFRAAWGTRRLTVEKTQSAGKTKEVPPSPFLLFLDFFPAQSMEQILLSARNLASIAAVSGI